MNRRQARKAIKKYGRWTPVSEGSSASFFDLRRCFRNFTNKNLSEVYRRVRGKYEIMSPFGYCK
jgi:hypothetical protein